MPRVYWPLQRGRASVEVVLALAVGGQTLSRTLLADTGAGARHSRFELIFDEDDCLLCGGLPGALVTLSGAYLGQFPLYDLVIRVPALGFTRNLRVVGVPSVPAGFDGIACFGFLNRFTFGNFGDSGHFGLEC